MSSKKYPDEPKTSRSDVSEITAATVTPTTTIADAAASPQKRQKRKKKAKRREIEISLWINSVKYEFGVLCTFCVKEKACVHCKECSDFYCPECDKKAHATKKRKGHIRLVYFCF
jgi:hypothetical protein